MMTDKEAKVILKERNRLKKEANRLHKLFLKTKFSSPDFELICNKAKAAQAAMEAQAPEFRKAFAHFLCAPVKTDSPESKES